MTVYLVYIKKRNIRTNAVEVFRSWDAAWERATVIRLAPDEQVGIESKHVYD